MKVFVVDDRFDQIRAELSGRLILIEKSEISSEKNGEINEMNRERGGGESVRFSSDGAGKATITLKDVRAELGDVLDFLSANYDFAALKGFSRDEATRLGINPEPVRSAQDVLRADEWLSLKTITESVKKSPDTQKCGAIGIFIGFVREMSEGRKVVRLEYEKYRDVFDRVLKEIEDELRGYQGVAEVKIHHRVGSLKPGEDIVYVVVMGEHRKDIWEPLAKSMEIVKERLPVWKKEIYEDGEEWVHDKHK